MLTKLDLTALWSELTKCLKFVSKLEGLGEVEEGEGVEEDEKVSAEGGGSGAGNNDVSGDAADISGISGDGAPAAAKLSQSTSAAALVTRFLPSIQSFFLLATTKKDEEDKMAPVKLTRVDR